MRAPPQPHQPDKLQRARLPKPAPARILRAGDVLVHAQGVGYALALWDAQLARLR